MATINMLISALKFARHGLAVLPCGPRAKHPVTPHGCKDATTDLAVIRHWWRLDPDANLGLATGAISGIFVLDVDPDHGGAESLAALERTFEPLPPTVVSLTGGGGRHLLFRHPGGKVRNLVGFYDGFDVRGDGGFIIAPPSIHPSGPRYRWASGNPRVPAEAPGWLLDIVKEPDRVLEVSGGRPPVAAPSRYAAAAVRRACAAVAGAAPGKRNSTLNSEAFGIGQLVGAGMLDEEDAYPLALAAFDCGLERDEIESTLRSGLHAGMARPREVEMEHV